MAEDNPAIDQSQGTPILPEMETPADYVPEGFESQEEFLTEARRLYEQDHDADEDNIEAAEDDLKFASGEQWDDEERQSREDEGKPCLTINTLPQFVGQVVGDRRINRTGIKVLPREDSDSKAATVRGGLIRNREVQSRAQRVYMQAFEQEVTCGIGNFRIDVDYTDDEGFDRDIFIRPINNALSVLWDFMHVDPTGRDATHCFVNDVWPRKVFERKWPDHKPDALGSQLERECREGNWFDQDTVRVTEFWRMIERERTLILLADGSSKDITDSKATQRGGVLFLDGEEVGPLYIDRQGNPRTRTVTRKRAQMHLITGHAILEGPYELNISRLPIIKCTGREVWVGNERRRFGLVRDAKDPQRLKNYWRSVAAEVLSKAPRNQWVGSDDAFEGWENAFREAHQTGDPILRFNKNATVPPQQVEHDAGPSPILQEAQMNSEDMKDVTGLQDPNLGVPSNERSGVAIQNRQRQGQIGTMVYHDNMNWSIQEAGDVINQLVPEVYRAPRTLRIMGEDEKTENVRVNDPDDQESIDLTQGKFDVTISVGPAYMTQMQEAAEGMMELAKAVPQLGQVASDLMVEAQSWPKAEEIAARLRMTIPEEIRNADPEDTDEEGQQQQQPDPAQQAQAQQMAAELKKAQAEAAEAEAQAREAQAKAARAEAEAQKEGIELEKSEVELGAKTAETIDRLESLEEPLRRNSQEQASSGAGQ